MPDTGRKGGAYKYSETGFRPVRADGGEGEMDVGVNIFWRSQPDPDCLANLGILARRALTVVMGTIEEQANVMTDEMHSIFEEQDLWTPQDGAGGRPVHRPPKYPSRKRADQGMGAFANKSAKKDVFSITLTYGPQAIARSEESGPFYYGYYLEAFHGGLLGQVAEEFDNAAIDVIKEALQDAGLVA